MNRRRDEEEEEWAEEEKLKRKRNENGWGTATDDGASRSALLRADSNRRKLLRGEWIRSNSFYLHICLELARPHSYDLGSLTMRTVGKDHTEAQMSNDAS